MQRGRAWRAARARGCLTKMNSGTGGALLASHLAPSCRRKPDGRNAESEAAGEVEGLPSVTAWRGTRSGDRGARWGLKLPEEWSAVAYLPDPLCHELPGGGDETLEKRCVMDQWRRGPDRRRQTEVESRGHRLSEEEVSLCTGREPKKEHYLNRKLAGMGKVGKKREVGVDGTELLSTTDTQGMMDGSSPDVGDPMLGDILQAIMATHEALEM
ncbi:hypothetical protein NDU88_011115 [Pleurodeles waltl]|uniref:Uncharacterized protein n=1 Tax=Pleurodeles waltl TaxID=8319 RepID=A0AAV7S1A0_PLEWA|nr:hypothetical protein NDU88_011115 [Pleurodeles waltl]